MILAILGLKRWLTLKRYCVLCFSLLVLANPAMAGNEFWEDRQRGYFWYEDPAFVEPFDLDINKQTVIIQPPDTHSYEELFDLHPNQFQVIIDARLKTAVHRPTEGNVLRFLEAVDVAKAKSRTLANVAGYVALQSPTLNGEHRYPHSQPGRSAYLKQRSAEMKTTLDQYRDRYAIIALNQEGCGYCSSQEEILARFEQLNHWQVRRIDINEDPTLAARFQVEITPTLLLVSRDTEKSQIIASGVIPLDQLNKRIYRLVRVMEGVTNPEQFYNMDFNTPEQARGNRMQP